MSHGPISQTTTLQALMSLLKGFIGTGILSMPKAFSHSGYGVGIIGTILIGMLCNYCIHMLVEVNKLLITKPEQLPYDYIELAENSFKNGPKNLRKYAKLSRMVVSICLFFAQLGFCCAYVLFIAKNLLQFAINLEFDNFNEDDVIYFLILLLPVMIILNFIKSIRHLAIGSTFANIIQLSSLLIIAYNLVTNVPFIGDRKPINDKVPQFVSTTVFTFEGITVTMPLYRSMKKRENFAKPFGVINMAIMFVIILYCSVGFLGYLKYGDEVSASVTLSLPNEPLYSAVQLMYALAITLSYPLQMYVAIHLIWPSIESYLYNRKKSPFFINLSDYVCRIFLVLLTFVLAVYIPELDLIIELIGAFVCSSVAIIIPTILHLVTFTEHRKGIDKLWLYVKDISIILFGLIAFFTGTYFSIQGIIQRFEEKIQFNELYSSTTKPLLLEKLINITTERNFTSWKHQ